MRAALGVLFFAVLGLVGNMDRSDQEAVEEFRREWVAVHDQYGEPVLVLRNGGGQLAVASRMEGTRYADALRDVPEK